MAFGLVSARWLHWTACLLLAASQLSGPFLVPRTGPEVGSAFRAWRDGFQARLGTFAQVTWALALLSLVLWFGLTAWDMTGLDAGLDLWSVTAVATQTQFGRVSIARLVILTLAGACLFASRHRTDAKESRLSTSLAVALTTSNALALALVGHAAATAGSAGQWHLAIDAIHLAAASVWPGGLVCFALLLDSVLASPTLDLRTVTARATGRFSASSLTAVAVLSATGLGNSLFFLHDASEVWTSRYGRLLAVKGFLFLGMLGFGAWNLLVLTRKLKREAQGGNGGPAPAAHALLRNVLWEVILGTVVILIVAVLGITEPPGR